MPEHEVAQQAPCAQIPELHSVPKVQVAPRALREHDPALQMFGDAQSASPVHVVLQTLPLVLQAYAPQELLVADPQVPDPVQRRGGV